MLSSDVGPGRCALYILFLSESAIVHVRMIMWESAAYVDHSIGIRSHWHNNNLSPQSPEIVNGSLAKPERRQLIKENGWIGSVCGYFVPCVGV